MMVERIDAPAEPDALPLYSGIAPGSESAAQQEVWSYFNDQRIVRNVTRPTLTPVLPAKDKANGSAIIVVPGGGFRFVSMDNEGWPVAQWLADIGVAAFVLKYRLVETPDPEADFVASLLAMMLDPATAERDIFADAALPIADAQAALRMVRAGAERWNIDPARVGMLGFSAGSAATLGATLADDVAARPGFIGSIYGSMKPLSPPDNAPPMFAAMASDDEYFGKQGFGLVESWKASGAPVEFHMYETGGHGFGSFRKGTTSDAWFDHFAAWLKARGLLAPQ